MVSHRQVCRIKGRSLVGGFGRKLGRAVTNKSLLERNKSVKLWQLLIGGNQ